MRKKKQTSSAGHSVAIGPTGNSVRLQVTKKSQISSEIIPLVLIYERPYDDICYCQIGKIKDYNHQNYGLIICNLVRHVAKAFSVHEDDVWEWVEKERNKPTTEITGKVYR